MITAGHMEVWKKSERKRDRVERERAIALQGAKRLPSTPTPPYFFTLPVGAATTSSSTASDILLASIAGGLLRNACTATGFALRHSSVTVRNGQHQSWQVQRRAGPVASDKSVML